MPTPEFSRLSDAIEELQTGFMGFNSRQDGAYTLAERMQCQAFVVFSHAEMESYLEKISRRILDEAIVRWKSSFIPDRVIATLIAYRGGRDIVIPLDPIKPNKQANLKEIVASAHAKHLEAISKNHGIKRMNVAELFCPLGVLADDFEEVLLIQLSNAGERRGDIVHQPVKVSLPKLRDPFSDEFNDIKNLIEEIGRFDEKLLNLGLL
jgi:hypothetical protein